MQLLVQLARESGLAERIEAMFRGEKINVTEGRAVLHVALRAPRDAVIEVGGRNVVPDVHAVLEQDGRIQQSGAQRRLERLYRQTDQERDPTSASAALISDQPWRTTPCDTLAAAT